MPAAPLGSSAAAPPAGAARGTAGRGGVSGARRCNDGHMMSVTTFLPRSATFTTRRRVSQWRALRRAHCARQKSAPELLPAMLGVSLVVPRLVADVRAPALVGVIQRNGFEVASSLNCPGHSRRLDSVDRASSPCGPARQNVKTPSDSGSSHSSCSTLAAYDRTSARGSSARGAAEADVSKGAVRLAPSTALGRATRFVPRRSTRTQRWL